MGRDAFVHVVKAAGTQQVCIGDLLVRLPVGIPELGHRHAQIARPGDGRLGVLPVFAHGIGQVRRSQRFRKLAVDVVILEQLPQ